MTKIISQNQNINDALDHIQFDDAIPVVKYKLDVYVLDWTGRVRGTLYYTLFKAVGTSYVAKHSVSIPFSKQPTLGEVLDRGEGLRPKHEPRITSLPAEAFSILDYQGDEVIINRFV